MSVYATKAVQTKAATVSSAAKAISHEDFDFSTAELAAAQRAVITPFLASVVATWSGVTVTAALGHVIAQNGIVTVEGNENVKNLQFIRSASTDATVAITLENE